ncbi:cytochrome c [Pedobacter sp.]|uniref:cytochrome c n=1 Tax=Pedobacter sp. TaxID=1411316 RepID=UPI0031DA60F1
MKILKFLGIIIAIVLFVILGAGLYINFTKPTVNEPPKLFAKGDSISITRGKYLANHVAVCIDCHSQRDWSLFSGPVIPGTEGGGGEVFDQNAGFPGKIYSSNLTPAALSAWSDGEIYRAITSGVGKDGHALFPLMSYPRFGKMSIDDVLSIIAYIRTLKPIQKNIPKTELDFPVSLLNKLGPKPAEHEVRPEPSDTLKYGAYLVNAAGCVDCHSKQDKGKIVEGTAFGGGMEFVQPAGIIRAPNITKHPTLGIGNWTPELFIAKFKSYDNNNQGPIKVEKGQLNTPMPWKMYSGMTTQDLSAIYSYLQSLKPIANKVEVRTYKK